MCNFLKKLFGKSKNPLQQVSGYGQSLWYDYIRRDLITSGELKRLIEQDDLRGMTSNPAIFEKAFAESTDYMKDIRELTAKGWDINKIYTHLSERDVLDAAKIFQPVYDTTNGLDGYVSLEVSPYLANDTEGTIEEARRLWKDLDRSNVLIKVPGTKEGLVAIQQLISEGININVTLLFGVPRYQAIAEAYISGLEMRVAKGERIDRIASVASFFLSRIDSLVDPLLDQQQANPLAKKLRGQVAIASAKKAYLLFQEVFNSPRFKKLAAQGARPQRLLWASTSTKDPNYSDVKYVEALIGPQTVNTVPVETYNAYRDHGKPAARLTEDQENIVSAFDRISELGINMSEVTQKLEDEGVDKFKQAFDKLFDALRNTAG